VEETSYVFQVVSDPVQFNATLRPLLLRAGISFDAEYGALFDLLKSNIINPDNMTEEAYDAAADEITVVWYLRMQLSSALNTYLVRSHF
jgi:hypothetical protein